MRVSLHRTRLNLGSPKVSCSRDGEGRLRHVEHMCEPVGLGRRLKAAPTHADLKELAQTYLGSASVAAGYDIEHCQVHLDTEHQMRAAVIAGGAGNEAEKNALRLAEIKSLDDDTVLTVSQSYAGLEVWQAGLSLSIHHAQRDGELVVTSSRSTLQSQGDLEAELGARLPVTDDRYTPEKMGTAELAQALGVDVNAIKSIESSRLLIYRYRPEERLDPGSSLRTAPLVRYVPRGLFPLRKVPKSIRPGEHHVVTEVLFTTTVPAPTKDGKKSGEGGILPPLTLNWRAFLDVRTGGVLYLRAFVSGCLESIFQPLDSGDGDVALGSVFCVDPMTATGKDPFALATKNQISDALNELRVRVSLPNIKKNSGEWQFLEGDYVQINTETLAPFVPNPRVSVAGAAPHPPDFTADILSDPVAFTAVSAYYHFTMVFRLMERLGFGDVMENYFHRSTASPILIDPDGTDGAVNALVFGNSGSNGVEKIVFGPMQPGNSQVGKGVGNASDIRVVLHEFCHTLLFAQLGSPNFGFAHSAGDSLAAILCDPDSSLRGDKTLRFQTFPWIASANQDIKKVRYHGGDVDGRADMEQWGWRGSRYSGDNSGYVREQILSMTMFHIYRALGGDSSDVEKRRLAALYTVYLLIKAISLFPSSGNLHSEDATVLAEHMIEADVRGGKLKSDFFNQIRGGCVHKVLRWGFEKHGLYSFEPVPLSPNELSPGKGEGAPQMVDVYINDVDAEGNPRCGEYSPTGDYATTEIWNRATANAGAGPNDHEAPAAGVANYLFVRIRNRGCETAAKVSVSAYFALQPAEGELLWDGGDAAGGVWTAMAGQVVGTTELSVQRGGEVVAGPFAWQPGANSEGKEVCVLTSVSAPGDPSNLDIDAGSPAPSYRDVPVPLWWLIPFDNNVGQRNMTIESALDDHSGTGAPEPIKVPEPGGATTGGTAVTHVTSGGHTVPNKDKDPNNPLGMEDWIDEVVDPASLPEKLPAMPANVVVLFGYLSDAERFAKRDPKTGEVTKDTTSDRVAYRLYRTPQLNDYLIIRHEDILHRGDVSEGTNPYGGSILWVKAEAQLQYVYTETMQAQATFLQGPFMGRGNPQYSQGGQPGGGASFACGGGSFACGGGSFACGGGSFACGGGSFACGGGSFACGGGSFACGGGSFACGGGSFACGGGSFNCP